MKIFPTKPQWQSWSMPSKLAYFGFILGVFGLVVTIILSILLYERGPSKKNQDLILKGIDEIKVLYRSSSQEAKDWITIKLPIPIAILPGVKAVDLIIKSTEGIPVEGFLKGEGFDLEYPFDSALNDKQPIAVKIKQPYIKFRIVSPKDKNVPFAIEATGYYLPR